MRAFSSMTATPTATEAHPAYRELIRRVRENALLESCATLLEWDEDTYMPPGGVEHRGNQLALLAGLHHQKATDPRIRDLLHELESCTRDDDPHAPAAVNIRELRRAYERLTRLPRRLIEELTRTTTLAQHEWAAARQKADFDRFRPWLDRIVALKLREAECLGYDDVPYDALLDEFEPGARTRDVAALFEALRRELVPLVNALAYAPRKPNTSILHREFPLDRQRSFGETVAAALGFDFERGRLDTATHPFFSTIGPGDCRLTMRCRLNYFNDGFFSILHELGHGLYEQGLEAEHSGTPMGEPVSLGLHESQARLWENFVGRSLPLWEHVFPLARRLFPQALSNVPLEEFHFALHQVEPSCNRVQADEVTYNLHIFVRFQLEQALLAGDLPTLDVPHAWNEAYRHALGVTPADDAEGCLQDSHWSAGLFGYFPTYTLGNIFAAQLFAKAEAELGSLEKSLAQGEFADLLGWLRAKVYRHGKRYPSVQLIEHVTGSPPHYQPLVCALRQKYGHLYGITI
jgi:carboxypeptidase Taq